MFCLLLTAFIYLSYLYLLSSQTANRICGVDRILFPFLMTSTQILLTELILGFSGLLYPQLLAGVNCVVSMLLFVAIKRQNNGLRLPAIIGQDMRSAITFAGRTDGFSRSLLFIVIVTYTWVLAAAYFLPPRGIDDLFYHLPPIFNYIQTHEINLLPVEIRQHFAFPQNAELLFMWPLVFSKNIKFLDAVNIPFVLVSIVAVHALLRNARIGERHALFLALLYAMCPVVIMQAGSNYIDVVVALFILLAIHYTVRYVQRPQTLYVCCAAAAIGMVSGMKYSAFFLAIPLQMVILWQMLSKNKKHLKLYITFVVLLSCWWFIRNYAILGSPFYPMNLMVPGMGFMSSGEQSFSANILQNIRSWFLQFPLEDIGLGSYDGGFGLVFWGLGFPSWIILCGYRLFSGQKLSIRRLLPSLYLPAGFLMLLPVTGKELAYDARLALFVTAIGLLSLGGVMMMIQERAYIFMLKTTCIFFPLLSIGLMSRSTMPSYRFGKPVSDLIKGQKVSEYRYVAAYSDIYAKLSDFWEPLDLLARDDKPGLDCYIAAHPGLVALAPLYGSNLQNRVTNIGLDNYKHAAALLYISYPDRYDFGRLVKRQINYYGYKIALEDALAKNEYVVVTTNDLGCLLLERKLLLKPAKQELLRTFYRERWPHEVEAAKSLKPFLQQGLPLVTSHPLVYGLRAIGERMAQEEIIFVQNGYERFTAEKRHLNRFYSLEKPVAGYMSIKITTLKYKGKSVELYLNKGNVIGT